MNQKHIGIAGTSEGGAKYFEQTLRGLAGINPPQISTALADFDMMQRAENGFMTSMTTGLMRSPINSLLKKGADFVVIPSFSIASNSTYTNTIELAFKEKAPLNMMKLTIEEAVSQGLKRPGLMGVRTTIKGQGFIDYLKKAGMDPAVPPEEHQEPLNKVIYEILAKGEELDLTSRLVIRNAVTGLKQQEVDGIIIACSDLSRVASAINFRTVVDATRILAQNTLEYARQKG